MIPALVIRPQPGCDATAASARALGLDAQGFPLFAIVPRVWEPVDPDTIDALLIGSANALRHGGPALARYRGKPAYAVGRVSADAARAAGLDVVATGEGGLQALIAALRPQHRRLLRLAGDERVAIIAPDGVTIAERVVYASEPLPLPPALAEPLRRPAVVLLHSAAAARHFAQLCDGAQIDRSPLSLAAIGPRVAEAAGSGWRIVAAAERPDDAALLALAREMCQTCGGSRQSRDGI